MPSYNEEKALLRAWKKKIQPIPTRRQLLKQELLELIEANDWIAFNLKRKALLSEDHAPDWWWQPHFNWFWNFIFWLAALLPQSWLPKKKPQSGSQLRQTLTEDIVLNNDELLVNTMNNKVVELSDNAYEDALFDNPEQALADVNHRLNTKLIDKTAINTLLERIHGLRYRLNFMLYQQLLEKIYNNYPREAMQYFYQIYKENPEDYDTNPRLQNYVELHMLARQLVENFSSFNLALSDASDFYNAQYLLTLVSLFDTKIRQQLSPTFLLPTPHEDPMDKLLTNGFSNSANFSNSARNDLTQLYSLFKEPLKRLINQNDDALLPFEILQILLEKLKPANHPLLPHLARQIIEQACRAFRQKTPQEQSTYSAMGYLDSIKLLSSQMIHSWPCSFYGKSSYSQQEQLLNPMLHHPEFPEQLKKAELFAVNLILAYSINCDAFIEKARELCEQFMADFLNDGCKDWLTYRLNRVNPSLIILFYQMLNEVKAQADESHLEKTDSLATNNRMETTESLESTNNLKMIDSLETADDLEMTDMNWNKESSPLIEKSLFASPINKRDKLKNQVAFQSLFSPKCL